MIDSCNARNRLTVSPQKHTMTILEAKALIMVYGMCPKSFRPKLAFTAFGHWFVNQVCIAELKIGLDKQINRGYTAIRK